MSHHARILRLIEECRCSPDPRKVLINFYYSIKDDSSFERRLADFKQASPARNQKSIFLVALPFLCPISYDFKTHRLPCGISDAGCYVTPSPRYQAPNFLEDVEHQHFLRRSGFINYPDHVILLNLSGELIYLPPYTITGFGSGTLRNLTPMPISQISLHPQLLPRLTDIPSL